MSRAGKCGIEAQTNVIVGGIGDRDLAVGGLRNTPLTGRALAGVFDEIEVSDDGVTATRITTSSGRGPIQ